MQGVGCRVRPNFFSGEGFGGLLGEGFENSLAVRESRLGQREGFLSILSVECTPSPPYALLQVSGLTCVGFERCQVQGVGCRVHGCRVYGIGCPVQGVGARYLAVRESRLGEREGFLSILPVVCARAHRREHLMRYWGLGHPRVELRANFKSISHRHLEEMAFIWELTKETIHLPLSCVQVGSIMDVARKWTVQAHCCNHLHAVWGEGFESGDPKS